MSRDSVGLLRSAIVQWNSGNVELTLDLLDPEIEVHSPFSSLAGAPYRGIAGQGQWLADIWDQFEKWTLDIEEIRPLERRSS